MKSRKTIATVITATMALSMTACGNSKTPYVENKTPSAAAPTNPNGNFPTDPFGTASTFSEPPIQEHMWEVIPEIPVTKASEFAYGYYDDGNGTGIVVTDYTGQSSTVRIPGSFEGMPVLKVEFGLCNKGITELVMPDTVKNFELSLAIEKTLQYANVPAAMVEVNKGLFNKMRGDEYIERCEKLTSVFIPDSVAKIGDYAFAGCESLKSVNIPGRTISIGEGAFAWCKGLTNVTIGNGVISIGDKAFIDCTNLTSVAMPESVSEIGKGAFNSCEKLESITIPNGVTRIYDGTFVGCKALTSITIPEGVTHIGDVALGGCTSLTSATIPDSVIWLSSNAFRGCTNLTSITYKGNTYNYEHIDDLEKAIRGN